MCDIRKIIAKEKGQVLVESALVMPLMIFFTLGILQMILIQHARILADYSAYAAARAGVVNSGNPVPMKAAANIAVLPAIARTNDFGSFVTAYLWYLGKQAAIDLIGGVTEAAEENIGGLASQVIGSLGVLLLTQLGPNFVPTFAQVYIASNHTFNAKGEVDFDTLIDPSDQAGISNSVMTVTVSFNYLLQIPFANAVLFEAWVATEIGQQLTGAIWNAQTKREGLEGFLRGNSNVTGTGSRLETIGRLTMKLDDQNDLDTSTGKVRLRTIPKLSSLWALANANLVQGTSYYLMPIYASYSMRMHSNLFQNNYNDIKLPTEPKAIGSH